jgi:hypothetical protein
MPTAGLSLVGFMPRDLAIRHLREACVAPDPSDPALEAEWVAAKAKLGAPIAGAGHPEVLDLPPEAADHMAKLAEGWEEVFKKGAPPEFKLVEIAPLLAFQFIVDGPRSEQHCGPFSKPPESDELLAAALPLSPTEESIQSQQLPQSIVLKARSLNVRSLAQGMIEPGVFGMQIGLSLPFVHVVRFNGRCYLHNGYHRCYGAAIQGATHIPCQFRDVGSPAEAGVAGYGATFPLDLLESNDPPTMAHFAQGRAHTVAVRATTRVIHISWAEYGMYDE